MAIKVLTDSSCDLDKSFFENNSDKAYFLGMPVNFEGTEYIDDLGKELTYEFIYDSLEKGVIPKTSQINVTRFYEAYEKLYNKGDILFVIPLSSGLSGTMNSARIARDMFLDDYEGADVRVIDAVSASIGLGAVIVETVNLINKKKSADEIDKWLQEHVLKSNHWFAVDDLNHLCQGGRISKAKAMIGTALKVKPILNINHVGELEMYNSVRGRVKSIRALFGKLEEHFDDTKDYSILVGHANCEKDGKRLKELIEERYPAVNVEFSQLSATIASHVGPGMLAIAFIGKTDREVK